MTELLRKDPEVTIEKSFVESLTQLENDFWSAQI